MARLLIAAEQQSRLNLPLDATNKIGRALFIQGNRHCAAQ